jgi:hypothetical protein
MKKSISIFLFIILSPQIFAVECGTYKVAGFVREEKLSLVISINEKTKSEVKLSVDPRLETKLSPYKNRAMAAEITILKNFVGTNGELSSIESISFRGSDPTAQASDTYIKLIKKMECNKK